MSRLSITVEVRTRDGHSCRGSPGVDPELADGLASPSMCCLALSAGFIGPRFALLLWWIFGDKVDAAFSSFIWPFLGLLFLPWTTLAYVLAWGPLHGVSGLGWLVVALGFFARHRDVLGAARPKRATPSSDRSSPGSRARTITSSRPSPCSQ